MLSEEKVRTLLSAVKDPELGLDIVSLGLIYKIDIEEESIHILMTMTFPGCPYGPQLVDGAKGKLSKFVKNVDIEVTFNPPWDLTKISPEAKIYLGI